MLSVLVSVMTSPNVVLVVADGLGAGDLASYGHPSSRMPSLDRLAREGTRFTESYSAGVTCAPSRQGLMTGRLICSSTPCSSPDVKSNRTLVELLRSPVGGFAAAGHFGAPPLHRACSRTALTLAHRACVQVSGTSVKRVDIMARSGSTVWSSSATMRKYSATRSTG
jgi:hypothetical protein